MAKRVQTAGDERRRRAEARLASSRPRGQAQAPDDHDRLVHELQVHQIELEMQNDELRSARSEIEHALQRYMELFDFAPVGYVVLDRLGTVLEANLGNSTDCGLGGATLVASCPMTNLIGACAKMAQTSSSGGIDSGTITLTDYFYCAGANSMSDPTTLDGYCTAGAAPGRRATPPAPAATRRAIETADHSPPGFGRMRITQG
jgi:hypothetical protein